MRPLKEVLRYVMMIVGIRGNNLPNDLEKAVLLEFIQRNYGGHTPEEIKLAFTLAIEGKLDLENVTCYENFSVFYFASIMNAYRVWAGQAYKQLQGESKIEETKPPKWQVEIEYCYFKLQELKKNIKCPLK